MASGLENIETVKSPFRRFVTTIGVFPTAFTDAMTYYECLAYLVKYMEETMIPAINENAEAVEELQGLYIQLKAFVDNYFDNLDVQEEINNKLDQMVEDGTLQTLINNYLQPNITWTFDTVADMKADTNLVAGSYARTLGFHSINDGGGAIYKISDTGTANELDVIAVGDLYANLCYMGTMNLKQFGAYGDDSHTDTNAVSRALAFAKLYDLPLYVPSGTYLVDNEFNIDWSLNIYGDGKYTSKIKQTDGTKHILVVPYVSCLIKDLCFEGVENATVSLVQIVSSTGHNFSNIIQDCEFHGVNKTGYGIELKCDSTYGIMDTTIKDCVFRQLSNGIRFDIGSGWINGNTFSNLWFYTTVNGIEWADTASYKSCTLNTFISIKGQYSAGVNSLIYNVNGSDNSFSDIMLWDGGITIQIGYHARYTKIRNVSNFEIAKFKDYGWHTEVDTFYGDLSRPHYLEKTLNFLTDTDGLEAKTTNGNTPSIGVVSNNPAVSVSTAATANDTIALQGKGFTLNGTGKQMINFSFRVDNIINIKLYLGMATSVYNQNQGNFLTFDTSVDNTATLKAIGNESTSTYGGTLAIPSFVLNNNWHKVQIWRDGESRLDVWIDGTYIGGFNASQKYSQTPFFKIQTLDGAVRTLSIGQVRIRTYVY